jgi:hypothetical protein
MPTTVRLGRPLASPNSQTTRLVIVRAGNPSNETEEDTRHWTVQVVRRDATVHIIECIFRDSKFLLMQLMLSDRRPRLPTSRHLWIILTSQARFSPCPVGSVFSHHLPTNSQHYLSFPHPLSPTRHYEPRRRRYQLRVSRVPQLAARGAPPPVSASRSVQGLRAEYG